MAHAERYPLKKKVLESPKRTEISRTAPSLTSSSNAFLGECLAPPGILHSPGDLRGKRLSTACSTHTERTDRGGRSIKYVRIREHLTASTAESLLAPGRFSGSRISLLTIPSQRVQPRASGRHGFRPRLQRRDRDGLSPSSLLNHLFIKYLEPFYAKEQMIRHTISNVFAPSRQWQGLWRPKFLLGPSARGNQ